jgi:hypothetical protein
MNLKRFWCKWKGHKFKFSIDAWDLPVQTCTRCGKVFDCKELRKIILPTSPQFQRRLQRWQLQCEIERILNGQ